MANRFTLTSGSYSGRYLELVCTQTKDIATNKSTISWTLSSIGGNSNFYSVGPTTVTINGVQVYYKSRVNFDAKVFPAAKGETSGTLTVDHGTDGSKSIYVSMTTAIYVGSTSTYGGTWTLDSIPRQATITSASDFKDTDNPSISFSNPGGFRMDVWLEPNPVGDHLCVRENIPNTGQYTWSLTAEEREALRNKCPGKDCTIRLGLYSYVGNTQYADYKDKKFVMTENDYTKPTVTLDVKRNNGSLPSQFNDMYIQGKSKVDVKLSVDGKYGANITSYSSKVDGKMYYNALEFTSDAIQSSGSVNIDGYAVDSRTFNGSARETINVIEYSKPLVVPVSTENAILCYRSDKDGKRTGNSKSLWIKAKKSYYKLSSDASTQNRCALQWRSKRVSEEWSSNHTWQTLLDGYSDSNEYSALVPGEFDTKEAYTVQIIAIDTVGEKDIKTIEVPTADVALHLGKGGKNVSIGSYCDYAKDYTFHCEWEAIFDNGIVIRDETLGDKTLAEYIRYVINEGG